MHVAVIVERYDPLGGGAERSTDQIARELLARGHDVTILAGTHAEDLPAEIEVRGFVRHGRLNAWRIAGFSNWVGRQLDAGGFDISMSVTTAAAANIIQPRSGTLKETFERNIAIRRSLVSQQSRRLALQLSPKRQMLLRLERRTVADPRVLRFLCNSRYVARQLAEHYQVPAERTEVLANASVVPDMSPQDKQQWRQRIRQSFGISDDTRVCLFAAYNPRLKGLDTLLRALQQLQSRGVAVKALLAGGIGFAEQQQCVQLGVRDRVCIVGPTEQMAGLYCAADMTVLPTWYDPASKVVIESLMMGVPAISTAYNGASDLIEPGEGQARRGRVLANPGDATALAAAIAELADPAEHQRCVAATAGLTESLSMRVHVDRLERVLKDVAVGLTSAGKS